MVNKIWNSILTFFTFGLIIGMIYNEISYNRISKFDYDLSLNQSDNIIIAKLENRFYIKEDSVSISDIQHNESIKKEFVPEKLYLLWFNYVDDKFYEFNGYLPSEVLLQNISEDNNIEIKFGKHNMFQLIMNEKIIQNFKAKEVLKPWFNNYFTREKMVFFARSDKKIIPYLNLKSDSEFSGLSSEPVSFYNFSRRKNDYADSLVNGNLLNKSKLLEANLMDELNLTLHKKNIAKKETVDYAYDRILEMRINLDPDQLYEILKSSKKNKFDMVIDIDKNDSLKSIYLIDENKRFKLNTEIKYDLNSQIKSE
ncbi:hypothetical protein [Chryseobacterium caseinilyticum]|uniref:DUF2931 family protein n=1 Tax=Chryseobacterium caseinilyticum TaxID=2771428 RepID=A0ABR8Z9D4_9FLAO|nr:hypothetical protein [Chryseobacterium caseinilyticum]MBD8081837.1 hypothetical protein [Chryseobacterium caseinilyticum]